ncbi:MAG TPA: hypothetical protein VFB63_32400 [Bryobacteraceae bacterium]|nr:hypothetical protein [Bryobacteraceae bacterium]
MATRDKQLYAALMKPFAVGFGLLPAAARNRIYAAFDNDYAMTWSNATRTATIEGLRVDANGKVHVGGAPALQPMYRPVIFRAPANADIATTCFHVFGAAGKIVSITEIHTTAGNDAGAVTGHVTKDVSGVAPGAGTSVMSGTFDLKGTANTKQTATLASSSATLEFVAGDRLSFKLTGTPTTAAGICLEVWVQYYTNVFETSIYIASGNQDQAFFVANRPYALLGLRYSHATAETTLATLNIQVTQDTSTNAPGAGTNLLTNNSNEGFACTGTANVPQVGTFTAVTLPAGDRLSIDYDGTATELAGIVVTATFTAEPNRQEISYWRHDTDVLDAVYFDADRDYELYDGRQVHSVAAGGASTANVERVSGTSSPSSGTAMLNTAWDLNATANTVQVADLVTVKSTLLIPADYRLSIDYANTEQSMVGMLQTLSLLAR